MIVHVIYPSLLSGYIIIYQVERICLTCLLVCLSPFILTITGLLAFHLTLTLFLTIKGKPELFSHNGK